MFMICLVEVFCPPVIFSPSLSSTSCERLSYIKHSHLLLWPHKCVFSCIVHEWPPSDQHIGTMLFASQCKGRLVGERGGPTTQFTVLHPLFFSPSPPPDSSPWSTEGHEYSTKCPLFITMQQRSMCATCMWTRSNLSVTVPASVLDSKGQSTEPLLKLLTDTSL